MDRNDVVLRPRQEKRGKTQHGLAEFFFSKPHTWDRYTLVSVLHTRRMIIEEEEESGERPVFIHNVVYESAVVTRDD